MPELSKKERLQLSLLDRLTDNDLTSAHDNKKDFMINIKKLRQFVQRDLSWLLNTVSMQSTYDLTLYPEVQSSGLNFGIADLTGFSGNIFSYKQLERELLKAVRAFEPRIISNTLKIRVEQNEKIMNRSRVTFEITGDLWAQPAPLKLFLKTEFDLEDGSVSLSDWN